MSSLPIRSTHCGRTTCRPPEDTTWRASAPNECGRVAHHGGKLAICTADNGAGALPAKCRRPDGPRTSRPVFDSISIQANIGAAALQDDLDRRFDCHSTLIARDGISRSANNDSASDCAAISTLHLAANSFMPAFWTNRLHFSTAAATSDLPAAMLVEDRPGLAVCRRTSGANLCANMQRPGAPSGRMSKQKGRLRAFLRKLRSPHGLRVGSAKHSRNSSVCSASMVSP